MVDSFVVFNAVCVVDSVTVVVGLSVLCVVVVVELVVVVATLSVCGAFAPQPVSIRLQRQMHNRRLYISGGPF